jgi:hypothetical protein
MMKFAEYWDTELRETSPPSPLLEGEGCHLPAAGRRNGGVRCKTKKLKLIQKENNETV